MELSEAKIYFDAGRFKSAMITEAILDTGYNLILIGKAKQDDNYISISRLPDSPRLFKTIDAACRNAREIGFVRVQVKLS